MNDQVFLLIAGIIWGANAGWDLHKALNGGAWKLQMFIDLCACILLVSVAMVKS